MFPIKLCSFDKLWFQFPIEEMFRGIDLGQNSLTKNFIGLVENLLRLSFKKFNCIIFESFFLN
jgi:hypothetical protein